MSFDLNKINEIFEDDTLVFNSEEMLLYPTVEQIANYRTSHKYYTGKYIEIWTLYFEIIEHLTQTKFVGDNSDEELMKKTMEKNYWISNDSHDVKFIALMFASLNKKITVLLENETNPTNNEWNTLLSYTSSCLPVQIHNMLANTNKSMLFGKYSIRNSPVGGKDMVLNVLESKI